MAVASIRTQRAKANLEAKQASGGVDPKGIRGVEEPMHPRERAAIAPCLKAQLEAWTPKVGS